MPHSRHVTAICFPALTCRALRADCTFLPHFFLRFSAKMFFPMWAGRTFFFFDCLQPVPVCVFTYQLMDIFTCLPYVDLKVFFPVAQEIYPKVPPESLLHVRNEMC